MPRGGVRSKHMQVVLVEKNATLKGKNRKDTLFVHVFRIQQSLSILILHYKPAAVEIIVMVAPERFQNIDLQKIRPEISPGNSRHMLICSMSTSAKGWPCFLLGTWAETLGMFWPVDAWGRWPVSKVLLWGLPHLASIPQHPKPHWVALLWS